MNDPEHKTPSLEQIQIWMQSVITHPLGIRAGIGSDDANQQIPSSEGDIEQVVCRSQALTSVERLEVYGNAYYSRLLECLREMFGSLVHALGEETFDEFAFGYLQVYPSRSYTLGNLANHFVDYLKETRPESARQEGGDEQADWTDFVIDLATLEWTIDQVFDGPGVEGEKLLTPADLQQISPEQWPALRLIPVCCLRLLAFEFPVSEYFTAFRKDLNPEIPHPQRSYLAVFRRDYIVRRFPLSRIQFQLLSALLDGKPVGQAIELAAQEVDDLEQFAAQLRQWFQDWGTAGFFNRIE